MKIFTTFSALALVMGMGAANAEIFAYDLAAGSPDSDPAIEVMDDHNVYSTHSVGDVRVSLEDFYRGNQDGSKVDNDYRPRDIIEPSLGAPVSLDAFTRGNPDIDTTV